MDRYGLIIVLFGFAMLVWAFIFINNAVYLFRLRKLLALVKQRWPEKWVELGEPKPFTFSKDGRGVWRSNRAILRFLRNPGTVDDAEIARVIKQTKSHLMIGIVGFPIPIVLVLLGVFLLVTGA
jgi:hypothetical protein